MVRRKIIWSPKARLNLINILDFYYKRNGSIDYSRKLNLRIKRSIKLLEKFAETGFQTDIENIRVLIVGDYCIFYRYDQEIIEIITIWDSRQNPDKLKL
ncbi:MAG: type II toxin-antitoxin system RelE/ParE family toxin [Bacteroidales bacterium]|nr:type II toxin-antitoxin system RelE/ParE family toxin [Bacteroidales bacterium]